LYSLFIRHLFASFLLPPFMHFPLPKCQMATDYEEPEYESLANRSFPELYAATTFGKTLPPSMIT
jgi:hypothetical protein